MKKENTFNVELAKSVQETSWVVYFLNRQEKNQRNKFIDQIKNTPFNFLKFYFNQDDYKFLKGKGLYETIAYLINSKSPNSHPYCRILQEKINYFKSLEVWKSIDGKMLFQSNTIPNNILEQYHEIKEIKKIDWIRHFLNEEEIEIRNSGFYLMHTFLKELPDFIDNPLIQKYKHHPFNIELISTFTIFHSTYFNIIKNKINKLNFIKKGIKIKPKKKYKKINKTTNNKKYIVDNLIIQDMKSLLDSMFETERKDFKKLLDQNLRKYNKTQLWELDPLNCTKKKFYEIIKMYRIDDNDMNLFVVAEHCDCHPFCAMVRIDKTIYRM
jgi:hypothetical protein